LKIYIGFDPGAKGAMACLYKGGLNIFHYKDEGIAGYTRAVKQLINGHHALYIGIEKVGAMPGQGVTSMLNFGRRIGELDGMLTALELGSVRILPREWQSNAKVKKKGKKVTATYAAISDNCVLAHWPVHGPPVSGTNP